MKSIRDRAKEHLPTVLLTLLSIVQALALELLWSHVRGAEHLRVLSAASVTLWAQITATFLGVVLIWVVYASNAVRFRWAPTMGDSVYPFIIGVLEFMLVETLSFDTAGLWFVLTGVSYGSMIWISHRTMRRARRDGENEEWFGKLEPARLKDFYSAIAIVAGCVITGVYILFARNALWVALAGALAANAILVWQFYVNAVFWERSIGEDP